MVERVLHLRSSAGFFGAERVIMTLMSRSQGSGVKSTLACIANYVSGDQSLFDQAFEQAFDVIELPCQSRFDSQTIQALVSLCEEKKIEVVHSHDYKSHFYALMASRKTKLPFVATLHGRTFGDLKNRIFEALENFLLRRAKKIIVVSDRLTEAMEKAGMANKTTMIANGVDEIGFNSDIDGFGHATWGFTDKDFIFGTVARFSQEKGHEVLLTAFQQVVEKHDQARLLLIGDGPLLSEMQILAETLGIRNKINFAGSHSGIERVLHDFDCYVSPSLTEGMPMSILEAMASNLPIIATEVGSVGDLLMDDCGKLIPSGETAPLAQSMINVIDHYEEAKEMGLRARTRVVDQYSALKQSTQYAHVYREVLEG